MPGLLDNLLVIDLTRALAGPYAGMTLGDLGARVIKVEHPDGGDDTRTWGPPFVGPDETVSTYYLSCNRNKESVTADLKTDEGRILLEQLLRRADVVLENFRPGVMDRLGFSAKRLHELNPRLVICSMTGFGHDGPDGDRAGYDQIAQGESGMMSITGEGPASPTKVGVPIGDILTGMNGVIGVLAALIQRQATGRGRVVRTSLLASLVGVHTFQGTRWTVAGEVPHALGNHHPSIAPYGLFRTKDSPVQLSVGSDRQWRSFAALVSISSEDPRFATNSLRVQRRDELVETIESVLTTGTADAWLTRFADAGIPAGRVRTFEEVYAWEQTHSQGLVIEVDHPLLGAIQLPGSPVRFDDNRWSGGRGPTHLPPPGLGEHSEQIADWLSTEPDARE